jgi:hypothetical protein
MNWFEDPAQLCATLDLDTKAGLGEAILIAIAKCTDKEGKLLRLMLGDGGYEEHIRHGMFIAEILIKAREIRNEQHPDS